MVRKSWPATGVEDEPESKSARTRARILNAAAHVLSLKGYAGTRLSDVAEEAELQAPAIYYYFPSRDDLIEEVMFSGIDEMVTHLRQVLHALPAETPPMDRIMAAVEAHLRHELELSDYATASIRNSGQIPNQLRKRQQKAMVRYARIWGQLFDDAAAEGQLRTELEPRIAQLLVMGALNWSAEWWDPRRGSVDAIVKNAQVLVRSALAPATAGSPVRRKRASGAAIGG
ncbi:TetR/AcrR family transcriptional regulator [Mycobacterium sp.]|uniref:TetR/AcrR family transcriptional regulator n=1 Tax=Mycobacterium sp. TaxID=1785 RepID=UPI000CB3EA3D|nr:TetR/AcrR family transcriptional regulator [Mycobacterium sp.]PJE01752.1 MAG: TetR family transcriptional regulator [Mycobacterium sp.]